MRKGKNKISVSDCTHIKPGGHSAVEIFETENEETYGTCKTCGGKINKNHPMYQKFLDAALFGVRIPSKGEKK